MFKSYKAHLAFYLESAYILINSCNDFLKAYNPKITLYIKKYNKTYKVFLMEKNRYATNRTTIYKTQQAKKLFEFIEELYKLMVG